MKAVGIHLSHASGHAYFANAKPEENLADEKRWRASLKKIYGKDYPIEREEFDYEVPDRKERETLEGDHQ